MDRSRYFPSQTTPKGSQEDELTISVLSYKIGDGAHLPWRMLNSEHSLLVIQNVSLITYRASSSVATGTKNTF